VKKYVVKNKLKGKYNLALDEKKSWGKVLVGCKKVRGNLVRKILVTMTTYHIKNLTLSLLAKHKHLGYEQM